ncbi:RING finger domain protein, partial [Aspergillus karnatakaensis]|uniref:E3 ubiquitin-protein ligase MARCH n=1 Tax=Aspergillus karnatakaensis TaxID=1810916 RepID=UPI003CCE22E1
MEWLNTPTWQFPSGSSPTAPTTSTDFETAQNPADSQQAEDLGAPPESPSEAPERHYPNRTCRICLESVPPTFVPPSEHVPGFLQRGPRVIYESSETELGRLLRPCKCKGSSRFVHEGCLQTWRHADPGYGRRNYYNCPTCGFQYRLERLNWARWISSTLTQLLLTCIILILAVFLLGFIADPIINLYVDPIDTIYHADYWDSNSLSADRKAAWFEHFLKGFASLGLLSFIQVVYGLSPLRLFNVRSSTIVRGGRGNTGRDRVSSLSWIVIVLGIGGFLWAVYKGVRAWSRRTLQKVGERVMDVPLPDDDDDGDGADEANQRAKT